MREKEEIIQDMISRQVGREALKIGASLFQRVHSDLIFCEEVSGRKLEFSPLSGVDNLFFTDSSTDERQEVQIGGRVGCRHISYTVGVSVPKSDGETPVSYVCYREIVGGGERENRQERSTILSFDASLEIAEIIDHKKKMEALFVS